MEEQRTELYCGVGTSNKGYNASLVEVETGEWNIKIAYGKHSGKLDSGGNLPDMGYKLNENAGYYEAAVAYEKLIHAKLKKGYEITYQSE